MTRKHQHYSVVKEPSDLWAVGVFGEFGPMQAVHLFDTEKQARAYADAANALAKADVSLTTSFRCKAGARP